MEKRWRNILGAAIDGAVVEPGGHDRGADLLVRTRDGRTIGLQAKWAGEGWPQDVRNVTRDVPAPWPAEVVVLARRLSPGAIEWLRDLGANWADETGQAHILGPDGLIVIREVVERAHSRNKPNSFSWSASAMDLAELILSREDGPLRGTGLARSLRWSVPQIANVLTAFDRQGWTAKRGPARGPRAHRELVDPDAMLGSWSSAVGEAPRPSRVAHRATRDVMTLLRDELAPALDRTTWAASGWAGLELAAPFATTTPSLHLYIADSDFAGRLSRVLEAARLREVEDGGRVTFWSAAPGVFDLAESRHGMPVVSPARLFADLTSFGARGFDAAAHVKEELIDPLHHTYAVEDGSRG